MEEQQLPTPTPGLPRRCAASPPPLILTLTLTLTLTLALTLTLTLALTQVSSRVLSEEERATLGTTPAGK